MENKNSDSDWFQLESNKEGPSGLKNISSSMTSSNQLDNRFGIPITHPTTAPEIVVPQMDGKTAKMYRLAKPV